MGLKRILSDAFSGGRGAAPRGTVAELLGQLKGLLGGSRRAAGRAIGVGESTLRGWDAGKRPKDAAGAVVKLQNGIRKLWRTDPTGGSIKGTIANPGTGAPAGRKVPVDPVAMQRAGDAWERGDLDGMCREFRRAVNPKGDTWYRDHLPDDGDDPDWDDEDEDPQDTIDIETSDPVFGGFSW